MGSQCDKCCKNKDDVTDFIPDGEEQPSYSYSTKMDKGREISQQ